MSRPQLLAHLQTFARVRSATPDDVPALEKLTSGLRGETDPVTCHWKELLVRPDARVIVALECDLPVGAVVLIHRPAARRASVGWIGVVRSAQRRGIGRLLLETAIAKSESAGSQVLELAVPLGAQPIRALARKVGFRRLPQDGEAINGRETLVYRQTLHLVG
jgi:GNAT superfamily N-acetyltransferase